MANLVTEGFDWFPSGQSLTNRQGLWGANEFFLKDNGGFGAADVVTGRFSFGKALALSGSFGGFFGHSSGYVVPVGATPSTGFLGLAMYVDHNLPTVSRPLVGFYDGVTDDYQVTLRFCPNGVIKVYNGDPDGTYLTSSKAGSYQEDRWFHCEIRALIADSGGTVEVRINTVPVIQLVGADTKNTVNAYFDSVFLGGHTSNNNVGPSSDHPIVYDDMFVNDTTGATENDWAGNLRVKTQFMIANGATDQFTIGGTSPAATNWESVLNINLDDSKYVFSATIGNIDLYTPDPNLNAPLVRVVQVRSALRQDDATQRSAKHIVRIGSTNYVNSLEHFTNQTYTMYKSKWELNPATGVSFTGTEVNGIQVGIEVAS